MKQLTKLNLITTTILSIAASSGAIAAEAAELEPTKNADTEIIEITGFRGSLQKSINSKRFANGVVDAIHAEDVGKSTDQNIADALSRVTGVTVQETDGEGTKISVRGAGSALNNISLNGVQLTSGLSGSGDNATADQGVDLSSYSSDILSAIEVYKTSSADQDEGSLGANVVLKTIRPLSLKNAKKNIELQGRYNQYSGEFDRKLSATYSDKLMDDSLGFIFTIADETQRARVDKYDTTWEERTLTAEAGRATDSITGEVITEDSDYITPASGQYRLDVNDRKRFTATAGIQYIPNADTEIQFDYSFSKQDINEDSHRYDMQFGTSDPNLDTDPQADWWVINQQTHTLEKRLMRRSRGRIYRTIGGQEVKNNLASLNIKHNITSDFVADLTFGYAKTDSKTKPNAQIVLTPRGNIADTPLTSTAPNQPTLEPSGFDCTSGSCKLVTGEDFIMLEPSETELTENSLVSNLTNPLDPNLFTVANVQTDNDKNEDTSKSVFLNFDWYVDFAGITKVEFGGKYANRLKDVSSVTTRISDGSPLIDENGEEFSVDGISSIFMVDVLESSAFPVDNFMDGLVGSDRADFLKGWGVVDPYKALEIVSPSSGGNGKDITVAENPSGSRTIEQTINAFYGKLNFEYFDGFVTGDVGIRYVETTTDATAYSRLIYPRANNLYDPIDLIYNQQLANTNLPRCELTGAKGNNTATYPDNDPTQYPTNLPAAGTCHLPELLYQYSRSDVDQNGGTVPDSIAVPGSDSHILMASYDVNGNVTSIDRNFAATNGNNGRFPANWNSIKAWADRSTVDTLLVDGVARGTVASERYFQGSDSASNDVWLPSLNLNFLISPELIGRVSASKTMARPKFDSTRPSVLIRENQFDPYGNGRLNTVDLKPLESKNLDLSLEWYFNASGLASIAYFRKDMKNFEEDISETYLWKDLRTNYDLEGVTKPDDILITPNAIIDPLTGLQMRDEFTNLEMFEQTPFNTDCMPDRMAHTTMDNPWTFNCHILNMTVVRNGQGALTQGLELNYTQNYDFLPGILSGLGLNVNYTFADSESDEEISETTGRIVKPLPQPYTPRHSANTTIFWEQDGIMLRLANRYNSTQLVSRSAAGGNAAIWLEASNRLDFSSSYKINKNLSLTFQALNLTDETKREFLTSTNFLINGQPLDEGNAMKDDVPTSRIVSEFKTGRQYRIGLRASF